MTTPPLPTPSQPRGRTLQPGDLVLLRDRKDRRYRIRLQTGQTYHTHAGSIRHDDLIGKEDGVAIYSSNGSRLLALRPTFMESVIDLPRQSQVIYPKDIGAILMRADIFPGARVFEVGMGSGAMTSALLRAVGPTGHVYSYDIREEALKGAPKNIAELAGDSPNLTVRMRNVYDEGIAEAELDRIVTDIPEPWRVLDEAARVLVPGGVLLCYLPTIIQVHQLCMALDRHGKFGLVETVEVLERTWHVTEQSVRPDHRMVAHTGFLTTARRSEPLRLPMRERAEIVKNGIEAENGNV